MHLPQMWPTWVQSPGSCIICKPSPSAEPGVRPEQPPGAAPKSNKNKQINKKSSGYCEKIK